MRVDMRSPVQRMSLLSEFEEDEDVLPHDLER